MTDTRAHLPTQVPALRLADLPPVHLVAVERHQDMDMAGRFNTIPVLRSNMPQSPLQSSKDYLPHVSVGHSLFSPGAGSGKGTSGGGEREMQSEVYGHEARGGRAGEAVSAAQRKPIQEKSSSLSINEVEFSAVSFSFPLDGVLTVGVHAQRHDCACV